MHRTIFHRIVAKLATTNFFNRLPDREYLCLQYWARLDQKLDLENPQTFNEKIQWLKLYAKKEQYTAMVDKYEVKKIVADKIGQEYLIPTLGVWERFEDIDFDALPDQFVLKCTHDSGGLVIVREKAKMNIASAKKIIESSLKMNYYYHCREWPYKNVKPRIIAEPYMQDGEKLYLPVYKFLVFDGEPRIIQVIQNDKTKDESIDYFDPDWNVLPLRQNFPNSKVLPEKPERLEEMLDLARKLGADMPVIRVDLYEINKKIYFSEFTFYSDGGFAPFYPEEWDQKLGEMIYLPEADPMI